MTNTCIAMVSSSPRKRGAAVRETLLVLEELCNHCLWCFPSWLVAVSSVWPQECNSKEDGEESKAH